MRKPAVAFFSLIFCFCTAAIQAQNYIAVDTLLVFTISSPGTHDTQRVEVLYPGQMITWWGIDNQAHEAKIKGYTNDRIVFDTSSIEYSKITQIAPYAVTKMKKTLPLPGTKGSSSVFQVDSNHSIMARPELEKLMRLVMFNKSMATQSDGKKKNPVPFINNADYREYAIRNFSEHEKKIAWRRAMKDTTRRQFDSVHHGTRYYTLEYNERRKIRRYREVLMPHSLTVNLMDPLVNNVTLSYGYRVCQWLGLDISPGFHYATEDKPAKAMPWISYIGRNPGMNHRWWKNSGILLHTMAKFYFPTRPNRYFGLMTMGRYFYYDHEITPVHVYYYHDHAPYYALQSEKSKIFGIALTYGWQVTAMRHVTFNFYTGIGFYMRWSTITEYSGGFHPYYDDPVQYPYTYKTSGWFPSMQGGVKIGGRFGKKKMK